MSEEYLGSEKKLMKFRFLDRDHSGTRLVFTDLVYTGGKTGEEAGLLFRAATIFALKCVCIGPGILV